MYIVYPDNIVRSLIRLSYESVSFTDFHTRIQWNMAWYKHGRKYREFQLIADAPILHSFLSLRHKFLKSNICVFLSKTFNILSQIVWKCLPFEVKIWNYKYIIILIFNTSFSISFKLQLNHWYYSNWYYEGLRLSKYK